LVKDGNKAIEYYQQALEMGDGVAANNLGALYQKGKFVKNDDARAFFYYQRGHELGDPDASYQYALYLCQGLCCKENVQEATEILLNLDPSSPDVAYTLAAIQWNEGLRDSPLTFQRIAEEGMPLAQYTYGLLLYLIHLGAETNSQNMLKESGRFIRLAAQNGVQAASSALRLLIERSRIEKEEARLIVKKLLKMDIEGARAVKQGYAQGRFDEKEQECQAETSLKQTAEALAERDPEIARKRQEQYLAHFIDPLNRKNVSVKGLYKIAASQASQQGGRIEPARGGGSGIKIKVGDNVTGFHNMHRSGQSSSATLDPGRANSFRNFVEDITQ
jgi:TPR repeat protein